MKHILRTTVRLYAEKPSDRDSLRLLRQVREEQHLRYADAIVAAVNAHQPLASVFSGRQTRRSPEVKPLTHREARRPIKVMLCVTL